jgi:hypothetical protein
MKFILLLGLIFVVQSVERQPDWMYKFLRWDCNSSGISVINPKCYVRSLSRSSQKLSISFEIIKKAKEVYVSKKRKKHPILIFFFDKVSFSMFRKTVTNWRTIIILPKFEYCAVSRLSSWMPQVAFHHELFRKEFPTLPTDCPVVPGKYSGNSTHVNMTYFYPKEYKISKITTTSTTMAPHTFLSLPNGIYRHIVLFSTKTDPEAYRVIWDVQHRFRIGEEEF